MPLNACTLFCNISGLKPRVFSALLLLGLAMLNVPDALAGRAGQNSATPAYGLFPADNFQVASGNCGDCEVLSQAAWYFQHETIAIPKKDQPRAGFARQMSVQDDLAEWVKVTPIGSMMRIW